MAPFVATLLQSGLSLLANAGLVKGKQWLKEKTGVDIDKAQLTPQELASLQQFQLEHEEELQRIRLEENKLDHEMEKAYLEDRQDARARDVEYVKAGKHNLRGDILAYGAVAALIVSIFLAHFTTLEQPQRDLVIFFAGVIAGLVKDVYSFEFGSSRGSKEKSEQMKEKSK
jgi:hypothetical protein